MPITIALVGIGGYGQFYLRELLFAAPEHDFKLVAAIDPTPERCGLLDAVHEAGVPVYPDLETFYQHAHADLVIIAAPIHLHAPLSCLAMSKGSNVLCEKPLGASLDEARQMLAAEKQYGKTLAIGFQWSFTSAVLNLKRDILAGRFGRPKSFKSLILWPRGDNYYHRNAWAGRIHTDSGALVLDSPVHNATAHYLHNMLFLLGETLDRSAQPVSLQAELYRANPIENYDTAALRVTTSEDVNLLFLTAHPVKENVDPLAYYEFENAVVEYPGPDGDFFARFPNGETISYGDPNPESGEKIWQTVEAIRGGGKVVCGVETALPQLICALGAHEVPVVEFPQGLRNVMEHGNSQLTWVEGLAETLQACYTGGRMPYATDSAPWAVPATQVDLTKFHL